MQMAVQGTKDRANMDAYLYPNENLHFLWPDLSTLGDGKGGIYQFQPLSTETLEGTYLGVLDSPDPINYPGRYVRVFERIRPLAQGLLHIQGMKKTLYIAGTTDSNGELKVNLTYDNTATGPSIFSQVIWNDSSAVSSAGVSSAVDSYVKVAPSSTSYKTTTHGFVKPLSTLIVIGGTAVPTQSAGAGVAVLLKIEGI